MHQVAISTASFCLWDIGPERKISICRELGFRSVEIAFSTIKMLRSFSLMPGLFRELEEFDRVTVHAPWCGLRYGENLITSEILDCFSYLCEHISIEGIVVHFDCIDDFRPLDRSGLKIYLENSNRCGSWELLQKALDTSCYPCVLDVNRATRYEDYLDRMLDRFLERIAEVHVSGFADSQGRTPILQSGQEYLLERVKSVPAPFIIEGLFSPEDIDSIRRERDAIFHKLFS